MIHESSPWKKTLFQDAELLERWAAKPCSPRRSFILERKVFLAAYSLRKLHENIKLSNATLDLKVSVKISSPIQSGFSNMHHWFDKYFDLQNPLTTQLTWYRIINILIHSATFVEVVDNEGHITGFMVTSDRELKRGLIHVALDDFISLMRTAAQDYPTHIQQHRHPETRKWITWAGHVES